MANRQSIVWCMRNFTSLSGLSANLRALSLCSIALPTTAGSTQTQVRALSSAILPTSRALTSRRQSIPGSTTGAFGAVQQQLRGMKVHSSIKKRCEHCKVRHILEPAHVIAARLSDKLGKTRLCDGRRARGQMATDMSSALRILGTNSGKARSLPSWIGCLQDHKRSTLKITTEEVSRSQASTVPI